MEFWILFAMVVAGLGLFPSIFLKNEENIFAICLLVVLIFISGFRYQIGWDYSNYERLFYTQGDLLEGYIEPSFIFLITFLKEFGFSAQMMFFVYTVLTLLLVYFAAKYYTNRPALFMSIYALIPYLFWNSMGNIRNYLAVAILFWGSRFLAENKFFLYMIIVAAATSVHTSASVFFILAPLLKFKYSLKVHILLSSLCFILSVGGISFFLMSQLFNFFDVKYAQYLLSSLSTSLGIENVLISTTLWILALFLLMKEYQKTQSDPRIVLIANMATFSFVAMEFFYFSYELERIRDYGFPFFIASLIIILDKHISMRFSKEITALCVAFMVVVFLLFVNMFGNNIDGKTSQVLSAGNIYYEFNFELQEK
ncbi:EpsG family protein [uncultured Selenomonas sp.]|uniref:EpsG family protein n=1 Tax=uncultured Selenomonas sp. TaxID=159275 RepID=UPI0028E772CF|nr:EpsG family protein [uncultured Selenomonas sp.]